MRTALILAVIIATMAVQTLLVLAGETGVDMSKIAYIESSGCKNMVGDGGLALGCYQLHAGVVAEYNQYRKASLKHSDVMNRETGLIVANWYMNKRIPSLLRHYKQPDTTENRLTAYNMGIGAVIKGKRANNYIKKYRGIK